MSTSIILSRDPLQTLKVDAIGYGAKDTGEMGGGAAAAVLMAAGPDIVPALQAQLAASSRSVGEAVLTDSFKLHAAGICWVIHIISIIKHTPQGAYCPQPQRLRDGVCSGLMAASKAGARSVALSALGTGEGRVSPTDAARYMIDGVNVFRQRAPDKPLAVTFSLPSFRDYEAFRMVLGSQF
jgi:O-acetyl-ADP-ribose deacetylase (regulator of RNase III)